MCHELIEKPIFRGEKHVEVNRVSRNRVSKVFRDFSWWKNVWLGRREGERKRSERFSWCEHRWRGDGKIIESRLSHRRTKEIFHRPTNFLAKWPCIKIAEEKRKIERERERGWQNENKNRDHGWSGDTMQRKSEARIKNSSIDKYDDNNNNNRRDPRLSND